ncbi:FAD-dependent monooxygenase [Paraburkholderia sp. BCC1884]|uniref:FAD-dependent monooxygenase n=1 Tax=Paraburkholderia sp. BCC1884 TaxID=2562668 RepID=UPI001183A42D|nr:FAD-dependent monooxygenase [Paraburkholderia sp. BCC1884]
MMDYAAPPVLIVGAGPTGITLALTLRRYGVNVRIIDRNDAPADLSKALAVWSGSLEALSGFGVVDRFQAAGVPLKALTFGDGDRVLARIEFGDGIDSPYPQPLLLPQSRTEAILTEALANAGVVVERNVELVGVAQDASSVTASLRHADGRVEPASCLYLVGADGARSAVRHAVEIEFDGYTEPETFLLGDVHITGATLDRNSIHIWWHNGGTVALFPFESDVWRIFSSRPASEGDATPTLDELQGKMDRHGPPGAHLHDPGWLAAFATNERLAARYRAGRVFLAGDAAHIHSPAGGQGMNTGLQDAVNLGWKLAFALASRGDAELLLSSYEDERRPVAKDMIAAAAQKLHAASAANPVARVLRDFAVSVVGHLPAVQKKLERDLSETELTYQAGALVALGAPPRHPARGEAGTRALDIHFVDPASGAARTLWPMLGEARHTLLVFGDVDGFAGLGAITAQFSGELAVLVLDTASDRTGEARARYRMDASGWVLIRPDQVVAARGPAHDLAKLATYLDHVVKPRLEA